MIRLPIGTKVSFRLASPVASSKNRRRIFKRGRRVVSLPSAQAVHDAASIREAAAAACGGIVFHDDDTLHLDYGHNIDTDEVLVTVTKIGEMPAKGKRGTKRDVHGMAETIADALQGVLFNDDRCIDQLTCGRVRA
jgi:hypothetical protein